MINMMKFLNSFIASLDMWKMFVIEVRFGGMEREDQVNDVAQANVNFSAYRNSMLK